MSSATNHDAPPKHPIAAVMHCDPYRYYADLVATKPLYRDAELGLWVASSAQAVTDALANDACRVRPLNEPVPRAIAGSPAGEIFRRLVRMNDGSAHCPFSNGIRAALTSVEPDRVVAESRRQARTLTEELAPARDSRGLTEFNFQLSARVIGSLLGVPQNLLNHTARWVGEFVRCVFPGGSSEQIEHGKAAARELLALFGESYRSREGSHDNSLMATLAHEAARVGCFDSDVVIANSIGLMSQAYEATAGLIGNTLLALAPRPEMRIRFAADVDLQRAMTLEVLRCDPPTHNTRRFLARDAIVAGQEMKAGDAILVVVAAANRDPAENPDPDHFDISRTDRRLYTFGAGRHACPGDAFAITIAQTAVQHLIDIGLNFDSLIDQLTYRPSANVRIPLFGTSGASE